MADDLYSIGLDPHGNVTSVPDATTPNGSIGGSDVGANAQDDQRVRDLIQQYLTDSTVIDLLSNSLHITQAGGGGDLLGGYFHSDWQIVVQLDDPPGAFTNPYVGGNHLITNPAGTLPVIVDYSSQIIASWQDSNASAGYFTGEITVNLYIDSLFMFQAVWQVSYYCDGGGTALNLSYEFPMTWQVFIDGTGLAGGLGTATAANQLLALAEGDHVYHLEYGWSVPNAANDTTDIEVAQELVTARSVPAAIADFS